MKKFLIGLVAVFLFVGIVVIGFSLKSDKLSFQEIKRDDIKEIAFNTRDDFYYTFRADEYEMDAICNKLQEITLEGSGTDDVSVQSGVKIRLTLKNGKEISFQGNGHTIIVENKAYYIEGNAMTVIDNLCKTRWEELQEENEERTDFLDLKEKNVRDVKVYDGISLCYKLSKEERNEILTSLHSMKLENGQEKAVDDTKKRYQIEKEDGVVVEFSVEENALSMNGKPLSVLEKDGNYLKEKQEKWLKEVREETRQMPFSDFNEKTVKSISLVNPSWADTKELTEDAKKEILDLLCQISVVGKGTEDYMGREGLITEAFLIEKEDGLKISISADRDPFIIDGKGYIIENTELAERLAGMYQKLVKQQL